MGFKEGADAAVKLVDLHHFTFGDLRDPEVLPSGLVAAPAIRLNPRLELPVLHEALREQQRLAGRLGFHEHRPAVELNLPMGLVDDPRDEREVGEAAPEPAATVPALPAIAGSLRAVNGRAFANSRDVAAAFEKQHAHVMRDIDALIAEAPACASSFGATSQSVPMPRGGSRTVRSFDMDRDGFSLLAMGFTGAKALRFKLAYIASRA